MYVLLIFFTLSHFDATGAVSIERVEGFTSAVRCEEAFNTVAKTKFQKTGFSNLALAHSCVKVH